MLTSEEADIVKKILKEVLSRECTLAGRANVNDIASRGGEVSFVSLDGASHFDLSSPLGTLASAASVVSRGITVANQIDLLEVKDPQELALKIQGLLPKSIADSVEKEALPRKLIEALSNHLLSRKVATPPKVMTWGLLPGELETVKRYVPLNEVEILNAPPKTKLLAPLLVGLKALPDLIAWADKQEEIADERPYPVLLSLLSGGEEPRGAWGSYDGVIRQDDLRLLKRLSQCSEVITAQLAANDVSSTFLHRLLKPISILSIAEIPFGAPEWNAENSEIRKHLGKCAACRRTFNETLEWRIDMPEQFLNRVRHIWLDLAVDPKRQIISETQQVRQEQTLVALVYAFVAFKAGLSSSGTLRASGDSELSEAIEQLYRVPAGTKPTQISRILESSMRFEDQGKVVSLQLQQENLIIGSLYDNREQSRISSFRVALWQNEHTVWEAPSEAGEVILPLAVLEAALQQGSVRFMILRETEE